MDRLNNCSECGSPLLNHLDIQEMENEKFEKVYKVECPECENSIENKKSKESAIDQWNKENSF